MASNASQAFIFVMPECFASVQTHTHMYAYTVVTTYARARTERKRERERDLPTSFVNKLVVDVLQPNNYLCKCWSVERILTPTFFY